MKVWVSRDDRSCNVKIWETYEPNQYTTGEWCNSSLFKKLYFEAFQDNFGFTPHKGSCEQYELTLEKIKK